MANSFEIDYFSIQMLFAIFLFTTQDKAFFIRYKMY